MTDPAQIFPTDAHRHVVGHLSLPTDDYGWTAQGLLFRLAPDPATWFTTVEQVEDFLLDLEKSGDAERVAGGWRMTDRGYERLTGPIKYEPSAGEPTRPANVSIAPDFHVPVGRVEMPADKPKRKLFKRKR
jgi:hypothetical protein